MIKIVKTKLDSPTNRLLSNQYTKEVINYQNSDQYYKSLTEKLEKAVKENWYCVYINNHFISELSDEWISKNIKDEYVDMNSYFLFKSDKDAVLFSLKWSSK